MFSHGDGHNFAVLRVRNIENLSSSILAERKQVVPGDVIVNQNLTQVLNLLHHVLLSTKCQIDALDLLVEVVIALVDFGLFTDEFNDLQFLYLLLVIWIQNLDLVSLIDEEILHDGARVPLRILLLQVDSLDHHSIGIVQLQEDVTGVSCIEHNLRLAGLSARFVFFLVHIFYVCPWRIE